MMRILIDPEHPEWLSEVIRELSTLIGEVTMWEEVPEEDVAQSLIDYCEAVTWGSEEDDEEEL